MPSKDRETNNRHQREWYARNRHKKIAENHAREDALRQQLRKLKEETPCADCGERYPYYVMDFDHGGSEKVDGVARLAGKNIYAALREAKKCEIVCANCHRIRSHVALYSNW